VADRLAVLGHAAAGQHIAVAEPLGASRKRPQDALRIGEIRPGELSCADAATLNRFLPVILEEVPDR
jgi:hypothetical protein